MTMTSKAKWPRRLGWSILALLTTVLLLAVGARWWLLHTESGAGFVLAQARQALQPALQIERSSGNISDGLRLSGVQFSNDISNTDIEQIELQAVLKLLPSPRLIIQRLYVDGVQVTVLPSDEPPPETLPDLRSPLKVVVQDLRLRELSLRLPNQAEQAEPLRLDALSAAFDYGDRLDLQRLQLQAYAAELSVLGDAALQPPYAHDFRLDVQGVGKQLLPQLQQAALTLHSEGDVDDLLLQLQGRDGLPLSAELQLYQALEQPRWELQVNSTDPLRWPLASAAASYDPATVAMRDFALRSSGALDDYEIQLNGDVQTPVAAAGNWQLSLRGDQAQIVLESLQGELLQGSVQASGEYRLAPAMSQGQLQLQLSQLRPARLLDDTGTVDSETAMALPPISGGLTLLLNDQQLLLQDLLLQAADLPWQVQGDASYGLNDEIINSSWRWQALDWPPGSGETAEWRSSQGQLSATGSLQNLKLDLAGDLNGSAFPSVQMQLQASLLEQQALELQQLVLQTLGGEVSLSGSAAWGDALQAQLDYQLQNIDPGQFWTAYPGSISASGSLLAGANADFSAPQATVKIDQLSGRLRGQPITGQGTLRYADQRLNSDGLQLQSGDARLSLRGDEQQLQLTLHIPSLGQLYAAAAGSLQANISMQALPDSTLRLDRGMLQLQLRGADLGWQQQDLQALQVDADVTLAASGLLGKVDVNLEQLSKRSNKLLREAGLQLSSDSDGQRLSLSASRAGSNLQLQLNGATLDNAAFVPWEDAFTWQGNLQDMLLEDRQLGAWQQNDGAGISYAQGLLQLQQACLQGSDENDGSSLCFAASQSSKAAKRGPGLQAGVEIDKLPVALLTRLTGAAVTSDQHLSGNIKLAMAEQLEQLDASLSLQPGRLFIVGDSASGVQMEQGDLQLQLIDDALSGDLLVRLEQQAEISSKWRYGPLSSEQPELSGDLRTTLPDLSLLANFVPVLNELAGTLNMHAQFKGPLPQPLIALDMGLRDGRIAYAPVGLELRDINLQGQSQPGQPFEGSGGFRAGDGQASMQFRLSPLDRTAALSIQGDSLQLADSQVLQLKLSPDLKLTAAPDGYTIDGELLIPSALLQPPKQVTTQQSESADVVVVGVEQPPEAQTQSKLSGKLKLVLGDDVRVRADVASTRLQGAVNLLWDEQLVPQADGSIDLVDGKVQAYGQTLILRDSRVSYNESPADNPRLDIYAVRRIFGDPVVSEAGVAITGRAQAPDIRLFTNPASNEESALAYIATGSNFDHGNGEGALNLGLYLFPRLFVSYGVGLFDNGNVTNARYEFSDSWNVTLESGQRDSAVQINWRKNKD
jgi:translocation and assembly module TamB